MGVSYEYETTVGTMIKQLARIADKYGHDTTLQMPSPGMYDPHFEGRNSCLTARYVEREKRAIIVEKDIK